MGQEQAEAERKRAARTEQLDSLLLSASVYGCWVSSSVLPGVWLWISIHAHVSMTYTKQSALGGFPYIGLLKDEKGRHFLSTNSA